MKYLLLLIALIVSGAVFGQTYNIPVKSGDVIRVRKNGTNVITMPTATVADSNYNITLVIQKKNTVINKPPVVSAGNIQSITLPANSVTLSGTATDDGTISSVIWNNATSLQANIVTPASTTTTVTDLVQGSYIFRLTATDNKGVSTSASVNITVNGAPPPPDTSGIKNEGFGASAIGGANSSNVYHVTNLNSSGTGSLSNGIGSNKTIVFDVSGTIVGRFDLIGISYLTIDGAGKDVTILNNNNGDGISFDGANTHHCIVKGVRVANAGNDCINVLDGSHDILITNCTVVGMHDGGIDVAGGKYVTVQYCLFLGGASDWSGDMLITAQNVSVHHCLFSPNTSNSGGVGERLPLVHSSYTLPGSPCADIRNNVMWKWGRSNGTGSGFATSISYGATANVVNNYYFTNQSVDNSVTTSAYGETSGFLYGSGNVSGNGINANTKSNHAEWPIPSQYQLVNESACDAAKKVKAMVGASVKNAIEQELINSLIFKNCPL